MLRICLWFLLLPGFHMLNAETLNVVVGETGCAARQQTVKKSWQKITGVVSVSVLARQTNAPGGQRTFVIVSSGILPTNEMLRMALGRRAKHYPILHRENSVGYPRHATK